MNDSDTTASRPPSEVEALFAALDDPHDTPAEKEKNPAPARTGDDFLDDVCRLVNNGPSAPAGAEGGIEDLFTSLDHNGHDAEGADGQDELDDGGHDADELVEGDHQEEVPDSGQDDEGDDANDGAGDHQGEELDPTDDGTKDGEDDRDGVVEPTSGGEDSAQGGTPAPNHDPGIEELFGQGTLDAQEIRGRDLNQEEPGVDDEVPGEQPTSKPLVRPEVDVEGDELPERSPLPRDDDEMQTAGRTLLIRVRDGDTESDLAAEIEDKVLHEGQHRYQQIIVINDSAMEKVERFRDTCGALRRFYASVLVGILHTGDYKGFAAVARTDGADGPAEALHHLLGVDAGESEEFVIGDE